MAEDKTYQRWTKRLEKEKKAHDKYRKQAEEAETAARDDDDSKSHEFNIQWANCKILRSSVYANRPKPDVRRRFQKPDPEEKELARMVERAIDYQIDTADFFAPSQMVVKDYIEVGLGVPKVIYKPETAPMDLPEDDGEPLEEIIDQTVTIEHVPWKCFHWEPGKPWERVNWVAFATYKPRKEVEEEYGVEIKSGTDDDKSRESEEYADEVKLYEIWHKPSRKVFVIAASHPEVLEERDDALNLQGFYPCPRPLFGNVKSEELIPKPDYQFIKSQVVELNRITGRIKNITAQIKAVGYYDSSIKGMERLKGSPDGTLQPVDNLPGAIDGKPGEALRYLPIVEMITTVQQLEQQRDAVKNTIYEVIGIADIIRGASKASETAAAQNLKGQWANVRLSEKSNDVARIWRDVFRIYAEIICEHFQPEILMAQTGIKLTPRMISMMKSDIGRSFAIDVETDSTIAQDDFENRQQTMDMVNMVLEKMQQIVPAVQAGMLPPSFVRETLLLVVNQHKHGKQLEDAIHELEPHLQGMQQFQQQMQQMQQALQQRDQQLQQAGQQMQGMQQMLKKFSVGEEKRKDMEAQAKSYKDTMDAQSQEIENRIVAKDHGIEYEQKVADVEKTYAEIDRMRQPQLVSANG